MSTENGIVLKCGSTILADGDPHGAIVASLSLNGIRLIDESSRVLAAFIVNLDRVTHRNVVQVTVAKTHASRSAALDHVLRHPQAICGVADLILQLTEDGTTHTWRMAAAAWRQVSSPAPLGVATPSVAYEITGGQILHTTTPDELPWYEATLDGGDTARSLGAAYWGGSAADDQTRLPIYHFDGGDAATRAA